MRASREFPLSRSVLYLLFFFFNDTATTEIYTLSLLDALPICTAPEKQKPLPSKLFEGLKNIDEMDIIEDQKPPQVFTQAQGNSLESVQKSIEQQLQPKTIIKEIPIR